MRHLTLPLALVLSSMACDPGQVSDGPPPATGPKGAEICGNAIDDDGDGQVDEGCRCDPKTKPTQPCYPGPAGTEGVGVCKAGVQQCVGESEFPVWGPCIGAVIPANDICNDAIDNDCDGVVDNCGSGAKGDGTKPPQQQPTSPSTPGSNPPPNNPPPPACSAANCTGCCDAKGACHAPVDINGCGVAGGSCTTCQADQICNATAGQCEAKPPSYYGVMAINADVSKKNCEGIWSFMDNCDPYLKVSVGGLSGKTSTESGTKYPTWNQKLFDATEAELLSGPMTVTVMDDDSFLYFSDDEIGTCTVTITKAILAAKTLVIPSCGKAINVTLGFNPVM